MKSPACSGLGGENFGVFESVAFYESVDAADFGLAPAQRAKAEDIRIIRGEDDPVAFTDSNQETGKSETPCSRCSTSGVLEQGLSREGEERACLEFSLEYCFSSTCGCARFRPSAPRCRSATDFGRRFG
jgi:hypothetical protein